MEKQRLRLTAETQRAQRKAGSQNPHPSLREGWGTGQNTSLMATQCQARLPGMACHAPTKATATDGWA
jgi:hypothetical protein